ncbi:unnamed protein product [Boreogadus saida]
MRGHDRAFEYQREHINSNEGAFAAAGHICVAVAGCRRAVVVMRRDSLDTSGGNSKTGLDMVAFLRTDTQRI